MIGLLIPLVRYRVKYELGSGKPYSEVDRLVLESVPEDEPTSLADLKRVFHLPRRLLIELLIQFFEEGWIVLHPDGCLRTPAGSRALSKGTPPVGVRTSTQTNYIMMELLTGALLPEQSFTYQSKGELASRGLWDQMHPLRAECPDARLDSAQAAPFLRHTSEQWIRSVAQPYPASSDWHWLAVEVNPDDGTVTGLPERWRPRLLDRLREEAGGRTPLEAIRYYVSGTDRRKEEEDDRALPPGAYYARASSLLKTGREHTDHLRNALALAKSHVLIGSSRIGPLDDEVKAWIWSALGRGVDVDLLWGQTSHGTVYNPYPDLAGYKELSADARRDERLSGWLRFNSRSSDSHANVIIYDQSGATDADYSAVVGSYPWLSERVPGEKYDLSVVVRHPGVIAQLCLSVAALLESGGNFLSVAPDRWRNASVDLLQRLSGISPSAEDQPGAPTIQVIRDHEHTGVASDIIGTAQLRRAVLSETIDQEAPRRLALFSRRNEPKLHVLYGDSRRLQNASEVLASAGPTPREIPMLRACSVIADNEVLVTSNSLLANCPPFCDRPQGEIGLLVQGGGTADEVSQWVGTFANEVQS